MNFSKSVTLVIFSSEGREHLLTQSFPSFLTHSQFQFHETILAIDGPYNMDAAGVIKPDIIIQQFNRRGYILNIISALAAIKTPYFFWLEDDFIFNKEVPLDYLFSVMQDESWAGIFLSRTAPLEAAQKKHHYFDGLYLPDFGFSVSPTLCNTKHIKTAFDALIKHPKDNTTRLLGFEPFINDFFDKNNLKRAVLDPAEISHVTHIGELESTAREFHMINSIDDRHSEINQTYLSGFGKERTISFYNKIAMLPKLWLGMLFLSVKLFNDRRAYDFAFRIYLSWLRKFKY